jgi:hypothetical protein
VEVLATTAYLYRLTGASHAAVLGVAVGLLWLVGFGDRVVLRLSRRITASLRPTPEPRIAVAEDLTEPALTAALVATLTAAPAVHTRHTLRDPLHIDTELSTQRGA